MVAMTMKSANSLDDTKLLNYQNAGNRIVLEHERSRRKVKVN